MEKRKLRRRDFLRLSAAAATGAVVAACAPATPIVIEKEVIKEVPVEKQVVVEKEVIKEVPVEKQVVVEKEVIKEVPVETIVTAVPKPVEKAELVFMSWGGGFAGGMEKVWYDECLPVFNKLQPDIKADFIPSMDRDKLIAAFVAGVAPDVIYGCSEGPPDYAKRGQLLDLQPFMDRDLTPDDLDDWYSEQLNFWKRTEAPAGQFTLPMYCGTLGLFYNEDLFDELGVDHPPRRWNDMWDHDEYLEAMLKFVRKDASGKIDRWGSQQERWPERVQMHLNGFGGHLVDPEDNTLCALGYPESQEALWWLYDRIWEDNVYPEGAQQMGLGGRQLFSEQKLAMCEEGCWALRRVYEQSTFKWNIRPFPKGPVRHVSFATTDGYSLWKGTKYPDAAWELMKFVTGRFFGQILCKVFMLQPSRKSVLLDWYRIVREDFPELVDVDVEVFGEAILEGIAVEYEMFDAPGPSMDLYYPAMESIMMTGDATPDVFKNGVCDEITAVNREEAGVS